MRQATRFVAADSTEPTKETEMEPVERADSGERKVEINNFIWMHGPSCMTLSDAEKAACDLFYAFERAEGREQTTSEET